MSADNTVAILVTKGRKAGTKIEVRVAHVQALENIEWMPDYPPTSPVVNREWLRRHFADAALFYDMEQAQKYAERVEQDAIYVEYGIQMLTNYMWIQFPASDRKRAWRQRHYARRR